MALFAAIVGFCHLVQGFTNAGFVAHVTALLGEPYTTRQATYDLRRLRRKGLISRIGRTHRYELTATGRRVAVLFTKTYGRVLAPGLALMRPDLPSDLRPRSALATAWRNLEASLEDLVTRGLAAA